MFDFKVKDSDKNIGIEHVYENKKKLHFLGTGRICKGHKLFKWKNGSITEVKEDDYIKIAKWNSDNTEFKIRKQLKVEKGCYYRGALNMKNAKKKFSKLGLPIAE